MLVLTGKTASGKTLIQDILTTKCGFQRITTYTTRPPRVGEIPDITYHYISEEDFLNKIKECFFAEWGKYNTFHGIWYYGVSKESLKKAQKKSVIILTPSGIKELKKQNIDMKIVYIYVDSFIQKERLLLRKDNENEAKRRVENDEKDFKNIENYVDKTIRNNFKSNIKFVINEIYKYVLGE